MTLETAVREHARFITGEGVVTLETAVREHALFIRRLERTGNRSGGSASLSMDGQAGEFTTTSSSGAPTTSGEMTSRRHGEPDGVKSISTALPSRAPSTS